MNNIAKEYIALLKVFLNNSISVEKFRITYFHLFKNENREMSDSLFELLDEIFGDIDAFCTDPELLASNPEFYLDESGLREKIICGLEMLEKLNET